MTPPAAPNVASQLAVLTERIEAQGKTLIKLEEHLANIDRRLTDSETARSTWTAQYERTIAVLENKTDSAHKRIDEHIAADLPKWEKVEDLEKEFKAIRDMVLELRNANNLLRWFTGIVGSLVVIWIVNSVLGLIK